MLFPIQLFYIFLKYFQLKNCKRANLSALRKMINIFNHFLKKIFFPSHFKCQLYEKNSKKELTIRAIAYGW